MKKLAGEDHKKTTGLLDKYENLLEYVEYIRGIGVVFKVEGLIVYCRGPMSEIGEVCKIVLPSGESAMAEVIAFSKNEIKLIALSKISGIVPGCKVYSFGSPLEIKVGKELLGRVIDSMGNPLDGHSLNFFHKKIPVMNHPPQVLKRKRISQRLDLGIKAMDSLLTVGKGQRLGIFSGTGVGKSTLLSMIARNASADINVVALTGERGREVLDFIERDLGEEGLKKSVLVVATADEPSMARVRCLYTATAIAEYFRDEGHDVLLMADSLTRMAMAQREIGAANREPPTTKGYPPSVFSMLPHILERAGTSDKGSITAFYNVLVEGDDTDDPIADAVRGVVDGHIVLSRELANRNHYPAMDISRSLSRLMPELVGDHHQLACAKIREWIAHYESVKELLQVGAYVRGENPITDEAIQKRSDIEAFLKQGIYEVVSREDMLKQFYTLVYGLSKARSLLNIETQEQGPKSLGSTDKIQSPLRTQFLSQHI